MLIIFSSISRADSFSSKPELLFPNKDNYVTGYELCNRYEQLRSGEKVNGFVDVPINYNEPAGRKTKLYYFLETAFDPAKPTVIYFKGGPGGSVHNGTQYSYLLEHRYNIIYFDQRGVKCSRPEKFEDFTSPSFYSSKNTARDANEIRKYFGVDKVIVFGNSYGSIPPTIFANFFPSNTKSVIIEGVVYDGNNLWEASSFWKYLANWLQKLTPEQKSFIEQIPARYGVSETWFTGAVRQFFYNNDPFKNLNQFLNMIMKDPSIIKEQDPQILNIEDELAGTDGYFSFEELTAYYMISCQELGKANPSSPIAYSVKNQHLISVGNPESRICDYLGLSANQPETSKPYKAINYRSSIPYTYFQGITDGATIASGATRHFRSVPIGFKQIFLRKSGGHGPFTYLLLENPKLGRQLMDMAVNGRLPSEAEKVDFGYSWIHASK